MPFTPTGVTTRLTKLRHEEGDDRLREELTRLLVKHHGNCESVAREEGCTRVFIWWLLKAVGMRGFPREVRDRLQNRFRLKPLDGAPVVRSPWRNRKNAHEEYEEAVRRNTEDQTRRRSRRGRPTSAQ